MKRFQEFTENVDKVAALKAKQRTAVDKFKSSGTPDPKPKPERKVHQGNVETENLIAKKQAKAKAMARKAEIRAEIQNEKQDK
tara:strand:- start:1092 stop:1340 length:249 start_codon:yes stop_codon:yes gene_type:complete